MGWNPIVPLSEFLGIPSWIICLVIFAVLIYVYGTWTFSVFDRMGVPCLKPCLPIFGNLLYLGKYGFASDHKLAKRFGKVLGTFEGRTPVFLVWDPEIIREITVRKFELFIDRRLPRLQIVGLPMNEEFRQTVSVIKGEKWKGARSVMTPTFSGVKLKKMTSLINECGREFCEVIRQKISGDNSEVELKSLFGCFAMDAVGRSMYGVDPNSMKEGPEVNEYVKNAKKAFETPPLNNPMVALFFLYPELVEFADKYLNYNIFDRRVVGFFRKVVVGLIEARKKMKQKERPVDFLQLLLDSHYKEGTAAATEKQKAAVFDDEEMQVKSIARRALPMTEVLANGVGFFLAGYETTATAMSWMVYNLALHPEWQDKLRAEVHEMLEKCNDEPTYEAICNMQVLDQVFCETLRLYPPVQRVDRVAAKDVTICGIPVPKGMNITFPIFGIHRCEQLWPDPDRFKPERFAPENKAELIPYSWIPFGAGPRNCIGIRLATLEAKIAVIFALKNFRFFPSENTETPPPARVKGQGVTAALTGKIIVGVEEIC